MANTLKILQWNANGILNKRDELLELAARLQSDVLIICETKLRAIDKFYLPGYFTLRNDRNGGRGRGGGVIVAVRKGIKFNKVRTNFDGAELIGIKIMDLFLFSFYNPPQYHLNLQVLELAFNMGDKVIIAGDFNSKHTLWNCANANANGSRLLDLQIDCPFDICFPTNNNTYCPSQADRLPATLDLTLCKNVNILDSHALAELSSDHLPISYSIELTPELSAEVKMPDFGKANWRLFREIINDAIHLNGMPTDTADIDREVEQLTQTIIEAQNQCIPFKTIKSYAAEAPSAQINIMIKFRSGLWKIFNRTRNRVIKKNAART